MDDRHSADDLPALRRTLAHVLALAVHELCAGAQLEAAGVTSDGFHCDFAVAKSISSADFPALERRMRELLAAERFIAADSLARSAALGDGPFAPELARAAADGFELRSLAGAYRNGDASQPMLSRIYAWAFPSRAELEAKQRAFADAGEREHKKLGRELDLFAFDDEIGAGLPLWLPNGTAIRDELEKLMKELEFDAGFERVATPHVARQELYYRTGHLPYYAEGMFPFMQKPDDPDGAVFALKPMNCPHHHKVFAARKRSHRELPFRIAEYGHVYRYEDSGAVSGILRTRCMCMNDAHIYCTPEQVVPELHAVLDMHKQVYALLGLTEFRIRLSTRGSAPAQAHKFVDDPEGWARSENILRDVLRESGLSFFEGPGEAAFYGPKIDFQFRMVTGREETASTLQLDFAMAERLDLSYIGPDGGSARPLIIHRAPLGTHERFVALVIERFGGAFPIWLAPVQARVLPVGESYDDYACEVQRSLRKRRVRADVDLSGPTLGKRIRDAALHKVPNVLVVGERERADRTVTLRRHGSKDQETLPLAAFEARISEAIATRSLHG